MKDGVHSMSYERYRAAAGVSKSMLDILAEHSPMHLRCWMDTPLDDTEATRFGTILHHALLEPDTYEDGFYVKPEKMNFATKDGKDWKAEHLDRPIISFNDAQTVVAMIGALHTHPYARRLLANGETEQNLFVTDPNGILRKSRLDSLTPGNIIPDVKTCTSADLDSIEKAINSYRYHVQGAYYIDNCRLLGIEKQLYYPIFVEKDPPYAVHPVRVMADVIEVGKKLFQRDLHLYRTCLDANEWPGYELEFSDAGLPEWAMRQMERIKL